MSASAGLPQVGLRALLTLAWPMVVSRSTQVVIGLSDALMVAHLGEAGLAATITGGFNTFVVLILPLGIAFMVSSFAAQLCGAGDLPGARRYGFYGLAIAGLAQVLGLLALPALGPALGLFDYAPEVRAHLHDYLRIRLLAGGAAIGLEALASYYQGLGNTRLPMAMNVAAMVLNVLLNWVLIRGHLGAPALGVPGAAWASAIASTVVFGVFLAHFLREGRRSAERAWVSRGLRLSELGRLLRFGLPSGLNWFFEFFAFNLFVNVVVAGLGTVTLAAFMAVLQLNTASFMPAVAFASAGGILVGQSIGAGRRDRVPGLARLTWGTTAAWMGLVALGYLLVPARLLAPFADERATSAAFLVVGVKLLRLSSAWQLADATGIAFTEVLRAAGDTAFPMWWRIGLAWALFFPGSWLTVRVLGHGEQAALGWIILYLGVLALVLALRFRSGAWRRIELVEPAPLQQR